MGGSGGFTRGLMYLEDEKSYTHCLFMDDDASCEIESIRRAYALLQYATTEKFAVAGAQLREAAPSICMKNQRNLLNSAFLCITVKICKAFMIY